MVAGLGDMRRGPSAWVPICVECHVLGASPTERKLVDAGFQRRIVGNVGQSGQSLPGHRPGIVAGTAGRGNPIEGPGQIG